MDSVIATRPLLLVVEDDVGLQTQLKWSLDAYEAIFAASREDAVAAVQRHEPAVVLLDLGLPPDAEGVQEGLGALGEILTLNPATKVIVVTGNGDRNNALAAVRRGAYDFYQKPLELEVLKLILQRAFRMAELEAENRRLATQVERSPIDGIVAVDDAMLRVCRTIEKIAPTDVSILILGESGTGKELIARAIHRLSARSEHRFVAINCAAIPENLLESELFGYEKGAFTGAHKLTIGKIELADGGTLFLDELGDMPLPLQSKILRFLQERVIERVGGRREISVNTRVVCATNQDLGGLIRDGRFREDLYYRTGEVTVALPPLRERKADVVVLARALLQKYQRELGLAVSGFTPDALEAILAYNWPGNVRELENRVKGAAILADGPLITAAALRLGIGDATVRPRSLREVRADAEREAIVAALAFADGNVSRTAELLGVSRPTLYDLLERLRIPAKISDA